ncbi:uncharacterized protein LOC123512347 [Portunus trituberculatus]|uniref:uncharacterized protein LOC123512347 n=1 Tax=Portunus trituberculatus TaxID=210409 RepID=UPI001E1D17D5|nr:uncharacterized protein LOC123512347 [Portunus trituberculatus]
MLPSTSSPVEAAPTPVSPSGPLPCQPQYVGLTKEGAVREDHLPPHLAELGMCGAEEGSQEGRITNPPPDLCARDGPNSQRHGNRAQCVEEAVGGAAIAQGTCDYEYALNDSYCGGERVDSMEEGTCGVASSQHCQEEALHCTEDMMCSPKAALPDLCDTSSGARSRTNYKITSNTISVEDMQCEVPGEAGGSQALEGCQGTHRSDRERVCDSYEGDIMEAHNSNLKNNIPRDVLEVEGAMEGEPVVADSVDGIPVELNENLETRNAENTGEPPQSSSDGAETSNNCMDSCGDVNDSHSLEMAVGPLENYLIHDNQQISLVACGITQCDPTLQQDVAVAEASETGDGMSLIKYNLHHSSHPMYDKWPCYFYITEEHLPNFTIDSHGKHIGSDTPPMFFPTPSVSRPASNLTEEEQVKIAKRMGLITHLPCGIFDGTKKSGECVICMIDFSVGDRVRYLPCMHTYHTECIDDWLMRSFTCPSCLEPVDAALLNTYGTS